MLSLYKRHSAKCKHRANRHYSRCSCHWWIDGTVRGRKVRESTHTSDRREAEAVRDKRSGKSVKEERITVEAALQQWMGDMEARHLASASLRKYRRTVDLLTEFCERKGIVFLSGITQQDIADHWREWQMAPLTASKGLERLSAFFTFAVNRGWLARNPMAGMKRPKVSQAPTLPFSDAEFALLLAACDSLTHTTATARAQQARCLLLVMRWTGLRISDAVQLHTGSVVNGRVTVRQEKTGVPVVVPVPDHVIAELERCPLTGERHYFWTGVGKTQTAVKVWTETLALIFRRSGLPKVGKVQRVAHRLRDTFAVGLLLIGTPVELVAKMLGHRSIKITEKHYSPWVTTRQAQAEEFVRRAWESSSNSLQLEKGGVM